MSTDATLTPDFSLLPDDPQLLKQLIADLLVELAKKDGRIGQLQQRLDLLLRKLYHTTIKLRNRGCCSEACCRPYLLKWLSGRARRRIFQPFNATPVAPRLGRLMSVSSPSQRDRALGKTPHLPPTS